jgi:hypothetical protein
MALHACDGEIWMCELRGPANANAIKTKEYCEFSCQDCNMRCLRERDLNGLWKEWQVIPDEKTDQMEIIQRSKSLFSHEKICKHEKHVATPADYQTLIRDAIQAKELKDAEKMVPVVPVVGIPALAAQPIAVAAVLPVAVQLPAPIVLNSIQREFQHFSCSQCGMKCDRYRELGGFWNSAWKPINTLLN